MMEDATMIVLWICTLLAALEGIALIFGLDGAYFSLVVAAIAGVGGYEVKRYRDGEA